MLLLRLEGDLLEAIERAFPGDGEAVAVVGQEGIDAVQREASPHSREDHVGRAA
jgi:hypothetical protein